MTFEFGKKSAVAIGIAWSVLSVSFFTGCSSSPSAGEGKSAVQARIDKQSEGRIKLVKFEKSNGVQGERVGFKIYEMEFVSEIEFSDDCKWVTSLLGRELSFKTVALVAQRNSGFSWNKFQDDVENPGFQVSKAAKWQVSGVIIFLKKERGWSVENLKLTQTSCIGGPDYVAGNTEGSDRLQRLLNESKAGKSSVSIPPQDIAAGSKGCVENLKQLNMSARLYSNDHEDKFPPSILSMSNELVTPKRLICPSDNSKQIVPSGWSPFSEKQNCSYEFLTPSAQEGDILKKPIFRCPIHGHVVLGDGTVREKRF